MRDEDERNWRWQRRRSAVRHHGHDHHDWEYEPSESRWRGGGPYGDRSRGGWHGGDYLGPTMSYGPEIAQHGGGYFEGGRWHEEPDWYRGETTEGGRFATFPEGPHRGRGPKGYARSDERIREDVCDFLTDHPAIDASDIDVAVTDGVVTLEGAVGDRRTKRWAERVAEEVRGVQDVMNHLRLRHREVVPRDEDERGRTEGNGRNAGEIRTGTGPVRR